jgi:chaperone modulatory protein CbpM
MQNEVIEVLRLEEHHELSLSELADLSRLSEAELLELLEGGVFAAVDPGAAEPTFHANCLVIARAARRLRDDFELDTHGIALVLALLDRVQGLEVQLLELRAHLPHRLRS